ncbi:MAG: tyrosine recombinase XerD [Rickettsiales bacterium]|nr:tyrosine recombinase XerD [Rickettsiales bacterium]|tara:strand:- start:45670 stop:46524 length:855 start_codon:yes stop_codon:yes gene_type:complete
MLVHKLPLFLSYCRSECSFSRHTCLAYETDLNQFFSIVTSVDEDSFLAYYQWLHHQSFAAKTIARKLASLRSFFQFCIREGYCDSRILLEIPHYHVPVRLPHVLDYKMVMNLLNCPDINSKKGLRDRVLLELLYSTGIRVSECIQLRIANIDLDEGVITILGKGNKQRLIPLIKRSQDYLSLYISSKDSSGWLFEQSNRKPLSRFTVYSIVKKYADKIFKDTVSVSPHSFRHAFATHLLEGGARLRDVQLLLGHQQLSSSQVYSHVATKAIKDTYLQAHPRGRL